MKCHTQKPDEMCILRESALLSISRPLLTSTGAPLVVARFAQRVAEPLQTFVETVARGGTCSLDVLLSRQFRPLPISIANLPMHAASSCAGRVCQ